MWNRLKDLFWNKIGGYIEEQIFTLFVFFGFGYLFFSILLEIIGLFFIYDLLLTIFMAAAIVLTLIKLIKDISKYGKHSFLTYEMVGNFSVKYTGVYIETFLVIVFMYVAFDFIRQTNSDAVGLLLIAAIMYRATISVIKSNMGKIVLNKKVEKLYDGMVSEEIFLEKTISETLYLLDHLYGSMQESMEEKLKSERLKTELITNISHDIKTPLTSIINYVDLLKNEENDTEKEKYINILDYNSRRLKSMVLDLIDASKTGTGNIEFHNAVVELNELILQVYSLFDEDFNEKGLDFKYETERENIFFIIDGDQLSRVFENLFSNVVKYSMKNTPVYGKTYIRDNEITIQIINTSSYLIEVSGEELLQQFVQGERSRHIEGSGLGLYIAKNIVELMGGKLSVEVNQQDFIIQMKFRVKGRE
ncbi:sensor histidine kinase [Gallicola sp. Sow4_E12]|uniref:sensor histidine kinase n=1 Tax=Gallicola sp. Sow4_E12 TaxID=3438785 RepID=UPI003F937D46